MVESNNAINNTVGASITGVTNTLTVTNASDTASSVARATITVGGASAGDPSLNFNVSGVTDWEMGIDNNDSDKWKLSQGTALGTNDTIISQTTGEVLKPLQPQFLAFASANINNVTGDGTNYTIIFDSEDFDVGGHFDVTTGEFTAPVSGLYLFTSSIGLTNVGAAHTGSISAFSRLVSATQSSRFGENSPAAMRTSVGTYIINGSLVIQLVAGDTMNINIQVTGGAKTVDIFGLATPPGFTWFSGTLLG